MGKHSARFAPATDDADERVDSEPHRDVPDIRVVFLLYLDPARLKLAGRGQRSVELPHGEPVVEEHHDHRHERCGCGVAAASDEGGCAGNG
jgi:hypothetical protein